MALSFHFSFCAPESTSAAELENFLKSLEKEARQLGFNPTLVLNVPFDTDERRKFARLLTTGHRIEDEKLKGVVIPASSQVLSHDPVHGECRLAPEKGVFLTVTDEGGRETVFGFLRYPRVLKNNLGKVLMETGADGSWHYRNFVDSPDPRYRTLVSKFAEAGYLEQSVDEYSR